MQASLDNDHALLSQGLSPDEIAGLTNLLGKWLRTMEPVEAQASPATSKRSGEL